EQRVDQHDRNAEDGEHQLGQDADVVGCGNEVHGLSLSAKAGTTKDTKEHEGSEEHGGFVFKTFVILCVLSGCRFSVGKTGTTKDTKEHEGLEEHGGFVFKTFVILCVLCG